MVGDPRQGSPFLESAVKPPGIHSLSTSCAGWSPTCLDVSWDLRPRCLGPPGSSSVREFETPARSQGVCVGATQAGHLK